MAAAIVPLVVEGISVLPIIINIFKSAIATINHSKVKGVPLSPTAATAANAAATQIAQVGIKAAVDNGTVPQSAVDSLAPNAQAMSTLTQLIYLLGETGTAIATAAPSTAPTVLTVEQGLIAALQAYASVNAALNSKVVKAS
jgi:hypothetical protein